MATESVIEPAVEEATENFSLAEALESDKAYRNAWMSGIPGKPLVIPPGIQAQISSIRSSLCGASALAQILRVDSLEKWTDGYRPLDGYIRGGLECALGQLVDHSQATLENVTKFLEETQA